MKLALPLLMAALLWAGCTSTAHAGPVTMKTEASAFDPFARGNNELEIMAGAFGGLSSTDTAKRPDFGFALVTARYGWMLSDPAGTGCCRGNWEFLVGAFAGPVFEGPGSYHLGLDLNLRYNFVRPQARIIPFIQISAGGACSDVASDDADQDYLGTQWNFALGASLGVRWMLSDRSALVVTFDYRHFSNAGNSERNRGYNGLGASLGWIWFF